MEKKNPNDSEIWQRPEGIIFVNLTKFTTLQRKVFLALGIKSNKPTLPKYSSIVEHYEQLITALPLKQQRLL